MSIGGIARFCSDEVEEPIDGLLAARDRDRGEEGCSEPGIAGRGEVAAQDLECFKRFGLRDGHGGFRRGVVAGREELRGPGDGCRALEGEDGGVAGSEEFW